MATTVGKLLVSDVLPPGLQDLSAPVTSDKLEDILRSIINKNPETYNRISKSLMDIGGAGAFREGITLRLSDSISTLPSKQMWFKHVRDQARKIRASNASEADKQAAITELYSSVYKQMADENYEHEAGRDNPFALQVKSKARGNKLQLAQLMATPGTFKDGEGNTLPLFIEHSYADGLTPAEYWGATYGARQSVIATKFATAEAGELGKQMVAAAMRMVVTGADCETLNGIPVESQDMDNIGAVLARAANGVPAGTVITKEILSKIKDDEILVRSPITCGQDDGICKYCSGVRETGRFPAIGDFLGVTAASALAERIAQGALNCLVSGTSVRMASGHVKYIEDIVVGDVVLGASITGEVFPVAVIGTHNQGIQHVYAHSYKQESNYVSITCTSNHPVLAIDALYTSNDVTSSQFKRIEAQHAKVIVVHSNMGPVQQYSLNSIVYIGERQCYDLSVAHPDELFVLMNGIICKNTKHAGGQKQQGDDAYAGFPFVEQFTQIPANFTDKATLADMDGRISKIEPAQQGGTNIYVDDQVHYVLPGHEVTVKEGDDVESGDSLSSGLTNPSELVKYKGLGEGRRYFTDKLTKLLRNSGWNANRRNVEVLSRALVNHVTLDDSISDGLPGDVMSYSHFVKGYKPRDGAISKPVKNARGMYLEAPTLHYSIGTRVDNKMIDRLNKFGISNIQAHQEPPAFQTFMPSLRSAPSYDKDWMAQLGSTYLKSNLLKNVHGGAVSTTSGTHPLPGIAKGVDFTYAQ